MYLESLIQAAGSMDVPDVQDKDGDLELIQQSLNGEADAYQVLVARYQGLIAKQMWRFSRDARSHEELVQDVFVQAFTRLHTYEGRAPFIHWLRRIATNIGYRYWKHLDRDRQRKESLELWAKTSETQLTQDEPSEAAETLMGLLGRLPTAERLVLTLLYFDGLDTQEIAEQTGWSRANVKVRAFRARKKLKQWLEDAGIGAVI